MSDTNHGADWVAEVVELHDVFQRYFRAEIDSLHRAERSLAPQFTIVSPSGEESSRSEIMSMLAGSKGQATDLTIETSDHRLIHEDGPILVTSYIEHHRTPNTATRRLTTAVFRVDPDAPCGVVWLRAHETWLT